MKAGNIKSIGQFIKNAVLHHNSGHTASDQDHQHWSMILGPISSGPSTWRQHMHQLAEHLPSLKDWIVCGVHIQHFPISAYICKPRPSRKRLYVGCCKWYLSGANLLAGEGDKLAGDSKIKTGSEEPGSAMCKLIVSTSFQERYFFARAWPYATIEFLVIFKDQDLWTSYSN